MKAHGEIDSLRESLQKIHCKSFSKKAGLKRRKPARRRAVRMAGWLVRRLSDSAMHLEEWKRAAKSKKSSSPLDELIITLRLLEWHWQVLKFAFGSKIVLRLSWQLSKTQVQRKKSSVTRFLKLDSNHNSDCCSMRNGSKISTHVLIENNFVSFCENSFQVFEALR